MQILYCVKRIYRFHRLQNCFRDSSKFCLIEVDSPFTGNYKKKCLEGVPNDKINFYVNYIACLFDEENWLEKIQSISQESGNSWKGKKFDINK
jgi:hypothetical protein